MCARQFSRGAVNSARPQHADTYRPPSRPTGKDTEIRRPTSIRRLGSWKFLSRSHSKAGTIGIRHMSSWDPRHSMHAKMLKCVRGGRERTAEGHLGYGEVIPFHPMWLTAAISAQPVITFTTGVRSAPQTNMEAKTCSACKQECTEFTRLPPLSCYIVKYIHVI